MPTTGAGICPAGMSSGGFGSPEHVPGTSIQIFQDPNTNLPLSGKRIDSVTRDYVLDDRGRSLGMTEAQQFVFLALSTDLGSSAMRELGNRLKSVRTISETFEREIRDIVTSALSLGVARGLITIRSIEVTRLGQSRLYTLVRWTDLSTGREQETQI